MARASSVLSTLSVLALAASLLSCSSKADPKYASHGDRVEPHES